MQPSLKENVSSLCSKIEKQLGIPIAEQRIRFGKTVLLMGSTLEVLILTTQ